MSESDHPELDLPSVAPPDAAAPQDWAPPSGSPVAPTQVPQPPTGVPYAAPPPAGSPYVGGPYVDPASPVGVGPYILPDTAPAAVADTTGWDSEAIVETRSLTKAYGPLVALNAMTLKIDKGSVFGLIGPNGAGKSTMFLILATLLRPTAGHARVCGFDPITEPMEVRRRMGYMPDVMGVYDQLTVAEYIEFHAAAYKIPREEWPLLIEGLLELVDLDVKRGSLVNDLSRGMKQRLSLARAMIHDPELLILDEPASGLDPRARIEFRELLQQLQSMGKTIIISSHILAELQQLCNEIGVIEAGTLLAAGGSEEIMTQLGGTRAVIVKYADGTTEEFPVQSDEDQQQTLKRLINDGRPIMEFTSKNYDLEDLFLRITQGIVQ